MAAMGLFPEMEAENGCLDTGCSVTLMDRAFLTRTHPGLEIRTMASPITVRGLGSNTHQTSEYVVTPLCFPGKEVTAITASREIHIVDDLKANILVGMDIMVPEQIDILASQSKASIGSCGTTVSIEMRARSGRAVSHPVHVKKSLVVPPHSQVQIPIHHHNGSLPDRNFFFEPDELNLTLYAHLVDLSTIAILAKNDLDRAVQILRNFRLGTIQEADFDNCYHIISGQEDTVDLASCRPPKEYQGGWLKRVFKKVVAAFAIALLAITATNSVATNLAAANSASSNSALSILTPASLPASPPEIAVTQTAADVVLPSGVTVY